MVFKKGEILKKFTRKHLCLSLFSNKVADTGASEKKEILAQVFSCEFC